MKKREVLKSEIHPSKTTTPLHPKLEFLNIIDREFRTSLNNIIGSSQLLKTEALTASQEQYLEIIQQSSYKLTQILSHFCEYINLQTDKLAIFEESFLLQPILENLIKNFADKAYRKGIDDIILFYKIDHNQEIICDPGRISQILNVFLDNAIRFSSHGSIVVTVENIDNFKLKITVQDQGVGIPQHHQQHLFDLFANNSEELQQNYLDSGLKLSICKNIIELMGGEIGISSQPQQEQGSSFWIIIPYIPSKQKHHYIDKNQLKSNPLHILVVDDNAMRGQAMCDFLCAEQEVAHYVSGTSAINSLYTTLKDNNNLIVILDKNLVSIDSSQLISEIKSIKNTNIFPVLMVSTNEKQQFLNTAENKKINYIEKPILPSELLRIITIARKKIFSFAPKILLIEDNHLNQVIEKYILETCGCYVDIAATSNQALQLLTNQQYELIITDIALPDQSGIELAIAIQNMLAKKAPPIVALTVYVAERDIENCAAAGIQEVLAKPVNIATLQMILQEYIPNYQGRSLDCE